MNKLKTYTFSEVRLLLAIALLFLVAVGCQKEDEPFSLDTLPAETAARLRFTDTLQLEALTEQVERIRTINTPLITIGEYTDPLFGQVDHKFISQLRLSTENIAIPAASKIKIDSVILKMAQTGLYGNQGAYTFEVYELDEALSQSAYYSNSEVDTKSNPIGTINGVSLTELNPGENERILSLALDTTFGRRLLSLGSSAYANNTAFASAMNGILVNAQNNQPSGVGGIAFFDPLSANTNLTVHYTNLETGSSERLEYLINDDGKYFIQATNNYSNTVVQNSFDNRKVGESALYVQGLAGTRLRVYMTGLDGLIGEGIIVHDAVLQFSVDKQAQGDYSPNPQLHTFGINDDSTLFELPDDAAARLDGELSGDDDTYGLRMTQYVQDIVDGQVPNRGLVVFELNGYAARTVLHGSSSGSQSLKLNLSYSTITK